MRNELSNRSSGSPLDPTKVESVPSSAVPPEPPTPIAPFHPLAVMSAQARLALLASNIHNQSENGNSQLPVTSASGLPTISSGSNPLYNMNTSGFEVIRLPDNEDVKNERTPS